MVSLTRADLEALVQTYRAKALRDHDEMRRWQNRAMAAEQKLAELEPAPLIERAELQ